MAFSGVLRLSFLLPAFLLIGVHPASAITRRVPTDLATIQGAINASAAGDTVRVGVGIWNERLRLVGKNLVLLGAGADSTTLSGAAFLADSLSILYLDEVDGSTLISGFAFEDGGTGQDWGTFGGAIHCDVHASPRIEANLFRNNHAVYGGAICSNCVGGRPVIRGNRFLDNTAIEGGGIEVDFADGGLVEENLFEGNVSTGCYGEIGTGGAIHVQYNFESLDVLSNVFFRNSAGYAGGLAVEGGVVHVTGNTFAFNEGTSDPEPNTGHLRIYGANRDTLTVRGNILAYATKSYGLEVVGCPAGKPSVTLDCNDFWGNAKGNIYTFLATVSHGPHDFFLDPLLCNPTAGVLTLGADSPCLAENNPTCGQVGALGLGCTEVSDVPGTAEAPAPAGPRIQAVRLAGNIIEFRLITSGPGADGPATLELFDLQGRLLKSVNIAVSGGSGACRWNGADGGGRPVASGVYFVRGRHGTDTATASFAFLR